MTETARPRPEETDVGPVREFLAARPGGAFLTEISDGMHRDALLVLVSLMILYRRGAVRTEQPTPGRNRYFATHLLACGCLPNDAGAHRVGCPDHPEGVRP